MQYTAADFNLPPLASVERFAELVGYKEGLIRRCARETKTVNGWPPLPTISAQPPTTCSRSRANCSLQQPEPPTHL